MKRKGRVYIDSSGTSMSLTHVYILYTVISSAVSFFPSFLYSFPHYSFHCHFPFVFPLSFCIHSVSRFTHIFLLARLPRKVEIGERKRERGKKKKVVSSFSIATPGGLTGRLSGKEIAVVNNGVSEGVSEEGEEEGRRENFKFTFI